MKVLLCEDIQKLGWLGDIVEVNTGYARNYLLPQGLAIVPSEANLKSLAKEKAKRAVMINTDSGRKSFRLSIMMIYPLTSVDLRD